MTSSVTPSHEFVQRALVPYNSRDRILRTVPKGTQRTGRGGELALFQLGAQAATERAVLVGGGRCLSVLSGENTCSREHHLISAVARTPLSPKALGKMSPWRNPSCL